MFTSFSHSISHHFVVRSGVSNKAAAIGSAKAGLAWIYDNFEFIKGNKVMKFKDALAVPIEKTPFHTGVIKGTGKGDISYRVPYDGGWHPSSPKAPADSSVLVGEALKKQLNTWVQKGVMEQDAASAVAWTSDYFGSKHDLSHCYFVMIGAGRYHTRLLLPPKNHIQPFLFPNLARIYIHYIADHYFFLYLFD